MARSLLKIKNLEKEGRERKEGRRRKKEGKKKKERERKKNNIYDLKAEDFIRTKNNNQ